MPIAPCKTGKHFANSFDLSNSPSLQIPHLFLCIGVSSHSVKNKILIMRLGNLLQSWSSSHTNTISNNSLPFLLCFSPSGPGCSLPKAIAFTVLSQWRVCRHCLSNISFRSLLRGLTVVEASPFACSPYFCSQHPQASCNAKTASFLDGSQGPTGKLMSQNYGEVNFLCLLFCIFNIWLPFHFKAFLILKSWSYGDRRNLNPLLKTGVCLCKHCFSR